MKHTLLFSGAILALALFSSCGGSDSIATVTLLPVKSGQEFQYIDEDGKVVINPQFSIATVFREGLALVLTSGAEGKYGFITEDGKYAINAQYKGATVFSDGIAWVVSDNSAPTAINSKGEVKFTMQDAEEVRLFKDGLAPFSVVSEDGERKWGFVNKEGAISINPQFSEVSDFADGICGVRNAEGKWGFIDKAGTIIINPQFDGTSNFKNGFCVVKQSNKFGVIDKEGKFVINPQFSEMSADGDMFLIAQNGKYGWCDSEGKLIINPQFSKAFPFNGSETTPVQVGSSYGFIDMEGKIVVNSQFDLALPFNGDIALVVSAGKVGFIDEDGKYVINPQYDDVSRDLVTYYLSGQTEFSSVSTDFFNIGAITAALNFEAPEGISLSAAWPTWTDVYKKLQVTAADFNMYSKKHEIFDKQLSKGVSYSLVISGEPETASFGGKPWSFTYRISIDDRSKADEVEAALIAKLTGYKRVDNLNYYSQVETTYRSPNDVYTVAIENRGGVVDVSIEEAMPDDITDEEYYGD